VTRQGVLDTLNKDIWYLLTRTGQVIFIPNILNDKLAHVKAGGGSIQSPNIVTSIQISFSTIAVYTAKGTSQLLVGIGLLNC
jgi:hypothetical protein